MRDFIKAINSALDSVVSIEDELKTAQGGEDLLRLFRLVRCAVDEGSSDGVALSIVRSNSEVTGVGRAKTTRIATEDLSGSPVTLATIDVSQGFAKFARSSLAFDTSPNKTVAGWVILENLFPALASCDEKIAWDLPDLSKGLAEDIKTRIIVDGLMSKILCCMPKEIFYQVFNIRDRAAFGIGDTLHGFCRSLYDDWMQLFTETDKEGKRIGKAFDEVIREVVDYSLSQVLSQAEYDVSCSGKSVRALKALNSNKDSLTEALIRDEQLIWSGPRQLRLKLVELISGELGDGL